MTTAEGQPPVDVADFDAKLAEHATLTGVPLDYLRFMICAQTAGALLPEGTALGGDADHRRIERRCDLLPRLCDEFGSVCEE